MRPVAFGLWGVSVALVVASVVIAVARAGRAGWPEAVNNQIAFMALIYPTVGLIIATRRPGNAIGWLFLAIGPWAGLSALASAVQGSVPLSSPASPAGADVAAWINQWAWVPPWFAIPTFVVLLFPDGRLVSPGGARWHGWRAPRWRSPSWRASSAPTDPEGRTWTRRS